MKKPPSTTGMRHVALYVHDLEKVEDFYIRLLGMKEEWRPDPDNVYLTSGNDNLALHRVAAVQESGRLDHIGFFLDGADHVDQWFDYLKSEGVTMFTEPRTHRDGARSFYCSDPDGTRIQMIYHPPVAGQ